MRAALIVAMCVATCITLAAQTTKPAGSSFVGVMVQEIDGARAKTLKLPEEAGVEVTRVEPESPAEKAGLKTGDVVLRYNGQRVEGMEQFSRLVRETPPGREAKLEIFRHGSPQMIAVRVGARIDSTRTMQTHLPDPARGSTAWRSAALGIYAEAVDGQLGQFFGVKDGVLVRSVEKNSAAEKAGIKAGDVIVRVDENHVASAGDLAMQLRARRGGTASIVVMREHRETTLTVKLDDDDRACYRVGRSGLIV